MKYSLALVVGGLAVLSQASVLRARGKIDISAFRLIANTAKDNQPISQISDGQPQAPASQAPSVSESKGGSSSEVVSTSVGTPLVVTTAPPAPGTVSTAPAQSASPSSGEHGSVLISVVSPTPSVQTIFHDVSTITVTGVVTNVVSDVDTVLVTATETVCTTSGEGGASPSPSGSSAVPSPSEGSSAAPSPSGDSQPASPSPSAGPSTSGGSSAPAPSPSGGASQPASSTGPPAPSPSAESKQPGTATLATVIISYPPVATQISDGQVQAPTKAA